MYHWTMLYTHDPGKPNSAVHGAGGFGNEMSLDEATRDVCLTIWDDLDRPYPVQVGGRVREH